MKIASRDLPARERRKRQKPSSYVPPEPPKAWERQAGEHEAAWGAFSVYRDLGPRDRSIAETGRRVGVEKHTLEVMSRRNHWVERCQAWDHYTDQLRRDADVAAIREMRTRHIQMAMSFQGAAALALNKIISAEKRPQLGPDGRPLIGADGQMIPGELTLKPSEVKDLAELGMKIERLNRGEPEAINETRVAAGSTGQAIEELRIKFVAPEDKKR